MKAEIRETTGELTFLNLVPESIEEIAKLLRLSKNSKPDNVHVVTYIDGNKVDGEISFTKYKNISTQIRNTDRRDNK